MVITVPNIGETKARFVVPFPSLIEPHEAFQIKQFMEVQRANQIFVSVCLNAT
jgi:hypothetical protein